MHITNHWSDQNTSELIKGIGGLAGQLLNKQNSGAVLSAQEAEIARLAQQTAATLGQANQAGQAQLKPNNNMTILLVGGGVLAAIAFLILTLNRK